MVRAGAVVISRSAILVAAVLATPALADPGPAPTFNQGRALGEAAIRATLIDPASAQIEWPFAFAGGTLKATLGKTREGWITCGQVNARNRMGGYAGRVWFLLMIRDGAVASLAIGTPDGVDAASATCPGLVKKAFFAPAPAGAASAAGADPAALRVAADQGAVAAAARGGLGVTFVPTPAGATLLSVAPGSIAAKAGLKPGETIESVNAIPIAGMATSEMMRAIGAATVTSVGVVGVGSVKVR